MLNIIIIVTFFLAAVLAIFKIRLQECNFSVNNKFLQNIYIRLFLVISLFVYRKIYQLPVWTFYSYAVANGSIILHFGLIRFYILTASDNNLTYTIYIQFYTVFLLAMIFGIVRLAFNVGSKIDKHPDVVSILFKDY